MTGDSGKKVAIIHRYFWPQNYPYATMLRYIAEGLVEAGHSVRVVSTAEPDTDQFDVRKRWASKNGIKLDVLNMPSERNFSIFRKAFSACRYALWVGRAAVRSDAEVVLVATTPPVVMPLVMRIAAKFRNFRYVYHCQDIHPEALTINGNLNNGPLYRLLRKVDTASVKKAAAVIVLSDDMQSTLLRRKSSSGLIHVVNNFSLDLVDAESPGFSEEKSDAPIFLFAGSLGRFQNLQFLIDLAIELSVSEGYRFYIMGDGVELAEMQRKVTASGASTIRFLGQRPLAEALGAMDMSDFGLVSLGKGVDEVAYPSKTMTYLSRGLPVVAFVSAEGGMARFLSSEKVGVAISPGPISSVAKSVKKYVELWQDQGRGKSDVINVCRRNFDRKVVVSKIVDVIASA